MEQIKFRTAYLVEPVKDFSALSGYCQQIKFLSTGKELVEDLPEVIRENLDGFENDIDAIVAAGRSNAVVITGMILADMFPGVNIWIGIYQSRFVDEKRYEWIQIRR